MIYVGRAEDYPRSKFLVHGCHTMNIFVCVYVCVCMCACMSVYVCVFVYVYVCVCVCVCVFVAKMFSLFYTIELHQPGNVSHMKWGSDASTILIQYQWFALTFQCYGWLASVLPFSVSMSGMLNVESKILVFNAFIVSNFMYCPLVWRMCSVSDSKKVEKIQERALH